MLYLIRSYGKGGNSLLKIGYTKEDGWYEIKECKVTINGKREACFEIISKK